MPAYADQAPFARPMLANESMMLRDNPNAVYAPLRVRAVRECGLREPGLCVPGVPAGRRPVAAPVRTVTTVQQPPREATRVIERAPRRDWKKTALVIGGSTATGAGVGAIFGGKKGALIGAAIGGGASTIYESRK